MRAAAFLLAVCILFRITTATGQDTIPTFGTTVVIPSGLRGAIYHIHHNANKLPRFEKLKSVGTIYTTSLNIPPQDFQQGFPGVSKRFEWFAIEYTGRFWIAKPGEYRFALTSDDGADLYIDGQLVIDNDGQHPPSTGMAAVTLRGGIHQIRVPYFQGPRYQVALQLHVAPPGGELRIFSTDEFKPPPNPETWEFPDNNKSKKERAGK